MSKTNNHFYSCTLTMGNMSMLETDMFKNAVENFFKAFQYSNYEIEKMEFGQSDYYYEVRVYYSNIFYSKVVRFSEALISFSLFWGIALTEHNFS
ncbi:hypothetical protein AQ623_01625 [Flavobacterium columnare]|nr:hypothetical protein AQ623_01625 [Flavobacterium columnare]